MTARPTLRASRTGFAFDRDPEERVSVPWLVFVVALAFVLRFIGQTRQSLWTDEVESLKLVAQPGADPLYALTHNFHGPLHKLLVLLWTSAFGLSDTSVRLLSVVLGTAAVAVAYFVARRWTDERSARWASALLAVNPFHVWYSQEVRGYILLMGVSIVSMHAFVAEVRARSRSSGAVYFLCSLAGALSSFGGLFLNVTQGVLALLASWRRGYPLRRFVVVQLLTAVCLVPYAFEFGTTVDPTRIVGIGDVAEHERLRGAHTFSIAAPAHSLYAYSVGTTLGPSINEMHESLSPSTFRPYLWVIGLVALAFGAAAVLGLGRAAQRPELAGFVAIWLLTPIVITALLAFLNVKVYNVRYHSAGLFPWVFLVGLGVAGGAPRMLRAGLVVVVLALSGASRWNLHRDTRYWRPDARSAAALVLREGRPGDRILLYTIPEPFTYYYAWRGGGRLEIRPLYAWHLQERMRTDEHFAKTTDGAERLWLVRYRSWYVDPTERYKRRLDEQLDHLGAWSFPQLPVDLYACGPGSLSEPSDARAGEGSSPASPVPARP